MLEKATERSGGRYTLDDVYRKIVNEVVQLWVAMEDESHEISAAFVTEITSYGQKKMLTIHFAGGSKMLEWLEEMDSLFHTWAVDHDCAGVELTGRKGWIKALEDLGWRSSFVVVEKSYE